MHAYLIIGADTQTRQKEITKRTSDISPWDMVRLTDTGISSVRDFNRELLLHPHAGKEKAGIIERAEKLTIEAQNALLKLLEEPPAGVTIFAETDSPEALLPTILSRVSVVRLSTTLTQDQEMEKILQEIFAASPGQKLLLLTPFVASRDTATAFTNRAMFAARDILLKTCDPLFAKLIKNLFAARSQLAVNVNQKLVLDHAFLAIV